MSVADIRYSNIALNFRGIEEAKGKLGDGYSLYMMTNENKAGEVLRYLENETRTGNTMLATSGLFCLNAFIARNKRKNSLSKPLEYLLLVDISENHKQFWRKLEHTLTHNDDVTNAISQIEKDVEDNAKNYFSVKSSLYAKKHLECFKSERIAKISWASSPEKYREIKSLFDEGKFIFKQGDLCDYKFTGQLSTAMQNSKMVLDSIYYSNVAEYAEWEGRLLLLRDAFEAIKPVITDWTLLIKTKSRVKGLYSNTPLSQCVTRYVKNDLIENVFPFSPLVNQSKI